MLVLPIVNRNRILNVRVSIKDASKVRTDVRLDNTMPSDIIVNGRSFLSSSFSESSDNKSIIDFIRANSILYKRDVVVTTKSGTGEDTYDVYEAPLPSRKVNEAMDNLYVDTILDMQKETPGVTKGKYLSLNKVGLDEVFSDEKVSIVKRIVSSNPNPDTWTELFRENGVLDLVGTLDFIRMFDCTVIGQASVMEDTLQQVLESFDKLHSKDTKSFNKYYNMALENRDIYAKMSYVNKLIYDRPFDLIQSSSQKSKQFVKTDTSSWESRKSA